MPKKKLPTVDVIASGYEWICPKCKFLNRDEEYKTKVTCGKCKRKYETNPPEHALGN